MNFGRKAVPGGRGICWRDREASFLRAEGCSGGPGNLLARQRSFFSAGGRQSREAGKAACETVQRPSGRFSRIFTIATPLTGPENISFPALLPASGRFSGNSQFRHPCFMEIRGVEIVNFLKNARGLVIQAIWGGQTPPGGVPQIKKARKTPVSATG